MNNKKWMQGISLALVASLAGCGISGTGGPSRNNDSAAGKSTPQDGQAMLGPIVGAVVTITDLEDLNNLACSATTVDNDDLAKAGKVAFDKPCIFEDHFYMVAVIGGSDVDYDDDGVRDATPTPNTGEFRALLSGEQLLQSNWKTSVLTESVYQALQYSLNAARNNGTKLDAAATLAIVDELATQLIKQDMNGDGVINRFDIALWHPVANANAAINNDKARLATQLIHQNLNRTLPDVIKTEAVTGHIDTLAPARQVLSYSNNLLVTTDTSLLVYQYQNGEATLLSTLALGWVYDMSIIDDRLYVALGENGIAEIDLATLQITRRWNTNAKRLTSLQQHIIFTSASETNEHSLMTLTDGGDIQPLVSNIELTDDDKDIFGNTALLKTIGNVVYWASGSRIHRFVIRDGILQQIASMNPPENFLANSIIDLEVIDNIAYVIASETSPMEYSFLEGIRTFIGTSDWNFLVKQTLKQRIYMLDISNEESSAIISSIEMHDVDSLRNIGGQIVGLGTTEVSLRDADTVRPLSSLPMPASFSGFDPVKGLDTFRGKLAIAAQENGVLLVDPVLIATKRFYGKAVVDVALSQATVTVRKLPQNEISCTNTTDDDGTITLTADCLKGEAYYRIDASGGTRNINGEQVPFAGTLHSIMHKSDFVELDHQWHVSPLTELMWQALSPSIDVGTTQLNYGIDDIAIWWFGVQPLTIGINLGIGLGGGAVPYEIYRWPEPSAEHLIPQFDAVKWQTLIGEFANGPWPSNALLQLTGVSGFMSYDNTLDGSAASGDVIAFARGGSIDLRTSQPPFARLGSISARLGPLAMDGNRLVSIDDYDGVAYLYDITDPANATLSSTVSLENMTLPDASVNYCMTANTFYRVTFTEYTMRKVEAWRLDGGTTSPISISNYAAKLPTLGSSFWCSDNRIIFLRDDNVFDVLQLSSTGLNKVNSIAAPAYKMVSAATLAGNRFFYVAGDGTESIHYELSLDNNGNARTVTELHTDAETVFPAMMTNLLFSNESIYFFTFENNTFALDTDTLESTYAFKSPLARYDGVYDTLATDRSIFMLRPHGHSFWQFKKQGVAP